MEDDTLSDKPQEAAHAVTDTIMQDADGAEGKSAERAADKNMADQDASVSTEEEIPAPDQGMQHTAGTPSATGAAQVSHEPVSTGTAPLPAQQAGVSGAGLSSGSAAKPPTAAGPGAVSGSRGGAMQTAQVRSASAGSVPNSSAGACSAAVAEQKAAQMYSPAAGILTKASGGGHTAAADLQPLTHRCPVSMTSSALAATPSKVMPWQHLILQVLQLLERNCVRIMTVSASYLARGVALQQMSDVIAAIVACLEPALMHPPVHEQVSAELCKVQCHAQTGELKLCMPCAGSSCRSPQQGPC